MASRGVVRSWDLERMHGVIDGDDVPGGCLVRFAAVAVDGFPALNPGEPVDFEWHQLEHPTSGYAYECTRAWPAGQQPATRDRRAFRTGLWTIRADGTADTLTVAASEQDSPAPEFDGQTTGIVRMWNDDEGWGVIDSPHTTGGCWAHFSHLAVDGFQTIDPGATVIVTWKQVTDQDGYRYCATRVEPHQP